jgi:4-amino-4-deoxy-L-arabinose transferase-like glycosyltransferase
MYCFFPLLFLLTCAVIMRRYLEGWREAALFAAIITAVTLTGITESLSLLHALGFYPLMFSWLILTAIAVKVVSIGTNEQAWPRVNFNNWALSEKILLGIIVFICMVSAVTAAAGSPNTWDSMTYHLSRVEHWIQDKTIGYYPTNIIRQLYIAPWAEYAITHLRILGGGEKSANFVQWMCMAGSLIGVSLIAGQLGANRRGQLLSSAIAACLPMGILQSVSTQTDYACSFWLTVFVFFIIETQRKFTLMNTIAVGLSLGLAFLTKGYSYILAPPFLIWLVGADFKQRFAKKLLGLLVVIVCALSLNMGQYWRNTQAFGSPAWTGVALTNESFGLKDFELNVLSNVRIQLTTSWGNVNKDLTQALTRAAKFLGEDIVDPQAAFGNDRIDQIMNLDEDYAGNCLHAVIFVIVFAGVWFCRGPRGKTVFYAGALLASFLLFCLIVRYQPWNGRFHLPLFVLFCPVAGAVLEHFLKQRSIGIAILLAACSLPWLFWNDQHPWFGNLSIWRQPKFVQYFYKDPYLIQPYAATEAYIRSTGCRQIGLSIGSDTWEYPWWLLFAGQGVRIEHVAVTNKSASLKYPLGDFQACALIVSGGDNYTLINEGNAVYRPAWWIPVSDGRMTVYLKKQ